MGGFGDLGKIDIIFDDPPGKGYRLVAVDASEIEDPDERYKMMIKKLMTYHLYVASGQFLESHPDADGKALVFNVLCKTEPSEAMRQVTAISTKQHPDLKIPVEVCTEQEFDRIMRGLPSEEEEKKKPWWRRSLW